MKFLTWVNIRLFLMIIAVISLFSFTSYRNGKRKIKKTEVVFVGDNTLFLKSEIVNKLLIEKNKDLKTINKEGLDLKKLEVKINKQKLIDKAEVFVSVDGVLRAVVKQKTPLGRVFNEQGTFYVDCEGNAMPLSDNFTTRVPLLTGDIDAIKKADLAIVLKIISGDNFLKKNIIGIKILPNGSLIMANRNYDFEIDFGLVINSKKKFNNYKAFFQMAVLDTVLAKYKKINLKFANQVVCVK